MSWVEVCPPRPPEKGGVLASKLIKLFRQVLMVVFSWKFTGYICGCHLYIKQKIEVLRPHKNFCAHSNFQIWLNYLDELILLDLHNISQDTFVGATSTPYKKLRSSGCTKTFAAHSNLTKLFRQANIVGFS